jgi:2-amino-4-hydroxy-6-hydroxymethyldihydropteridine diphosphokinase
MGQAVRAYIGLGSNLDNPRRHVRSAITQLAALPYTHLTVQSSLYRSEPMGPADQPDYINAVAAIDTLLTPYALLDALLGIERLHGRVRSATRWGPRTLDLDILIYGDRVIDDVRLTVPHPGIAQRAFVLHPLAEIAPEIEVPNKGPIRALMEACPTAGLQKLVPDE